MKLHFVKNDIPSKLRKHLETKLFYTNTLIHCIIAFHVISFSRLIYIQETRRRRESKKERFGKEKVKKIKLTTSVLAAAVAIVDVGVHHPAVADVVLVMTPTPVATGMDPLPANPAELDKSPTSIRCSLISRCKPFTPVPRAVCSVFDVATQHFRACLTSADAVENFLGHRGFSRSLLANQGPPGPLPPSLRFPVYYRLRDSFKFSLSFEVNFVVWFGVCAGTWKETWFLGSIR